MDPFSPAIEIAAAVRGGAASAEEVCRAAIDRIDRLNPVLNAFIDVTRDRALQRAGEVDRLIAAGEDPGPLAGVPVGLKDNICTRFGRTTCASKMLSGYRSPFDATVVERLEAVGAVIVGKTNMDEFAMGSSTENSAFGAVRNPWSTQHVPGGSSGGATAAVAAGLLPAALGSDTGGSIRQPASLCGVVGVKPTYGRVSRFGLVAYGSSLDQIGPIARTVGDAALLFSIIAGPDPLDSTCVNRPADDYLRATREPLRSLRIGIPREYFGEGLDPEVRKSVDEAIAVLESLGGRRVDVSMPHSPYCVSVYYLVATAEASSNLARFDGVHYGRRTLEPRDIFDLYSSSRSEGFGSEVKRRVMLGTFALSSGYHDRYYLKGLKVRRLIRHDFEQAFAAADVLVCPASPTPAFRIGEKAADPLAMYLADIYTIAANLAGVPGIVLPCGFSSAGLPIGVQLLGPGFSESLLFRAAAAYERETAWLSRRPKLPA